MHALTPIYARLLAAAYAEPGAWKRNTLESGSVLAVQVPADARRADRRMHRVALLLAPPFDRDAEDRFHCDVREVARYLERDERVEWEVVRQGKTKLGGLAAHFGCRAPKPVSYALPTPAEEEAAHA